MVLFVDFSDWCLFVCWLMVGFVVCWLMVVVVLVFVGWCGLVWFVLLVVCCDLCIVVGITRCLLFGWFVGLVWLMLVWLWWVIVVGWSFGFIFIVGYCVGFWGGVVCWLVVFVDYCCGVGVAVGCVICCVLICALFVVLLLVGLLFVGCFVFCFGWCHWFGFVVWVCCFGGGFRFGCVNVIVVFCLLRYVWLFVL